MSSKRVAILSLKFDRFLRRKELIISSTFNEPCSSKFGTFKYEWESGQMPVRDLSTDQNKTFFYGFGLCGNGELGVEEFLMARQHARPLSFQRKAYRLPLTKFYKVKFVSCGHGFSVFATSGNSDPRLFGTGINSHGQIGYQNHKADSRKYFQWLAVPRPIILPLNKPKQSRITHIACGLTHTVVATTEGVFSLGNNCHGQGGREIIENEDYRSQSSCIPHRIKAVEKPVRQLICGLDHTLILLNDGTLVSFGLGTDGQLGDGSFITRWQPKVISGDLKGENIVQIASSADCCLAVSDKGDLFGWGNSEYKQLSVATHGIQVAVPTKLNFTNVGKVKKVAVGGSACLLLNDKGEVYSWGYGFLGHGPQNIVKCHPTLLPPPLFGCNQFDSDIIVRDIFAGLMNFGAVNSRGELFVWGKNDWASLGLNHDKEQFFPVKSVIGYDVTAVSFARFHTIVTVKER